MNILGVIAFFHVKVANEINQVKHHYLFQVQTYHPNKVFLFVHKQQQQKPQKKNNNNN